MLHTIKRTLFIQKERISIWRELLTIIEPMKSYESALLFLFSIERIF